MESILQKERPEVLIVCSGDILDLPASYILSKKMHIPLICYMFDDYSHQWTGLKGMLAKLLASFILSSARKILVPNEFLKKSYLRRYHRNAIIIHNPSSRTDLTLLCKEKRMLPLNTKNIIYTGSIYHAHHDAFYNLIYALQLITDFDIRLHIYSSQSEKELRKLGIINNKVIYHNHVSEQSASIVQRQADILFLPLAFNSPIPVIIRTSSPGKLGEYLAARKPILAHVPKDSFVSWYITKYQCGIVVNDNNPYTLSKAIHQLMTDRLLQKKIERNAGERAEKDFSIAQAINKFINVINSM
jgi:glycosyltransferase involved in cell wall biosynthesis